MYGKDENNSDNDKRDEIEIYGKDENNSAEAL